jgi:cyclomaltodextrinase
MAANTQEWIRSAIIYEVFPRNHTAEGTFAGIYRDLERIASLHTDILWLMPIHPIGVVGRKGTLGSPYAISDYRAIHPELGDERSFRTLVDKAHALGMKVMIDVVYNHTSRDSRLLREHPEWFLRDAHGNPVGKVDDWSDVYDLDYSHKDLWEYQIATLGKWVDCGVDGFRCDVASMVPLDFWMAARERLAQAQPKELIWLAESVDKSFIKFLRGQGFIAHSDPELHAAFDLTYDYDGFEYLRGSMQGLRPLGDYLNHLYIQETLYPAGAVKMRFIENHDNPRAAGVVGSRRSLLNWTVFYSLLPGATLVYAGQERALSHCPDLFSRDPIHWDEGDPEFPAFIQKVLGLSKAVKRSCTRFAVSELCKGVAKITWRGSESAYVALVNLSGKDGQVYLDECEATQLRLGKACLGECLGEPDERGRRRLRLDDMPLVISEPLF